MLKERYIYKGKKKDIYTKAKRKIQMLKERYIYKG